MKAIDNATRSDAGALLLALVGVMGFSGTLPATRLSAPYLGAIEVGLGRAIIAALCGVLLLLLSRSPRPRGPQWGSLALVALGVVVGFPLLSAWALTYTNAGRAAVIIGLAPLLTAVYGTLRGGTRQSVRFWVASFFGTACVALYLALSESAQVPAVAEQPHFSYLPEVALLVAACAAAVGYTEGARLTRSLGGLQVISWALILALPLVLPVVLSRGTMPQSVPWSAWLGFGYVSVVSMFLAFYFWYSGLSRAGVARASQLQLLQPLLTVTWAVLFLNEEASLGLYATAGCVLLCVVVALSDFGVVGSRALGAGGSSKIQHK